MGSMRELYGGPYCPSRPCSRPNGLAMTVCNGSKEARSVPARQSRSVECRKCMVYCSQTEMAQTRMALPARQVEARVSASGRSFSSGKGTRSSLARHWRIDETIDETRRIDARRIDGDSGAMWAVRAACHWQHSGCGVVRARAGVPGDRSNPGPLSGPARATGTGRARATGIVMSKAYGLYLGC